MYEAADERYCYPGTTVLRNRLDLRDQNRLNAFEAEMTAQRFDEPLPTGRLSVTHYCAIHRHIFQDVYTWAGRFRTVRIAKGSSMFCYPDYIGDEMQKHFAWLRSEGLLRRLDPQTFAMKVAHFLATVNAIHPFRDGNGRTQLAFMALLADAAGHPLDFDRLNPDAFLTAMIHSFNGDEAPLANIFFAMISDK